MCEFIGRDFEPLAHNSGPMPTTGYSHGLFVTKPPAAYVARITRRWAAVFRYCYPAEDDVPETRVGKSQTIESELMSQGDLWRSVIM
jgi:hypothetical protein